VSELQLTAPANAGVQKAKSVCKPWRILVSELHTYFVEKRHTKSAADRLIQELLRLPCPSGRNRLPRKFSREGGRSGTVFERGKSVAPTVPAPSGRSSLPRKLICLGGRSEPPLPPLSVFDRIRCRSGAGGGFPKSLSVIPKGQIPLRHLHFTTIENSQT